MEWAYEHTPYVWPMLFSVIFLSVLGIHGIRHRNAPGAVPFVVLTALAIPWVTANALRMVFANDSVRIFCFKFESALVLPLASAGACFAVEYAGLGKFLTRRTISVLIAIPLVFALLVLTNESHGLVWTRIWVENHMRVELGAAHWVAIAYGYILSLLHLSAMAFLFVRSPRHRWIAAGLFAATFVARIAASFNVANKDPVFPLNPMVLVLNFTLLLYALAFFRFRMFDVVPVARNMVIDGMKEGMLVLDSEKRVADINETARELLGLTGSKYIGVPVEDILQEYPDVLTMIENTETTRKEMPLGNIQGRWFQVSTSTLSDRRGFYIGRLVWFYDVTDQRNAREQILDQQRTLAVLKERELLARELHDGIGQMLAAVRLHVQSARELLAKGETAQVESFLRRLSDVAQEAKESVRAYLVGVKIGSAGEQGLMAALGDYLKHFSHSYGIRAELVVSPEMASKRIDAMIEVQLQPIILEALANVRKHAGDCSARVIFAPCEDQVLVTVEDDGRGFDPDGGAYESFGLRSMRGRAESAGGFLEVDSSPGKGTRVNIRVPLRKEKP